MNTFLRAFLALFLPFSLGAQTITISDKSNNDPVPYAVLRTGTLQAVADAKGAVDAAIFKGQAAVEVRALGYEPMVVSFEELTVGRVRLNRSVASLGSVVVSASRWAQPRANVPSKIVALDPTAIARQMPQTMADQLAGSGRVFIQKSQQGGGSPMIRGFATNRLLLVVDGVRMNTAIFRGGNVQNVISLDPFATATTEVLFGPGSVSYGSDAVGGVLSFTTVQPEFSDTGFTVKGNTALRFASANLEKTGHVSAHFCGKRWAAYSAISTNQFDHLRMGSYGPSDYLKPFIVVSTDSGDVVLNNPDPQVQNPSAYDQVNFTQKLRFKLSPTWKAGYGGHFSTTTPYGRYDRHLRLRGGQPRYAEWNYGPQFWTMHHGWAEHLHKTKVYDALKLNVAYQQFRESRIDRALNDDRRAIRSELVNAYSASIDFQKELSVEWKLFYGLESVANEVVSTGRDELVSNGARFIAPSRYPQAWWFSNSAFATAQWKPTVNTTIQGGLRYSHFALNAQFDTSFYAFPFTEASLSNGALTGSLGMVQKLNPWLSVRGAGATAFRSPNVDDLGKVFDSEPGTVTVPNPDLKAEYAYNAEVGAVASVGNFLEADLGTYYTHLSNALVRRNFQLNGADSILYEGEMSRVQAIQNAANARVYGMEGAMRCSLPAGFAIQAFLNYQVGEEELDDGTVAPLRHAAPTNARAALLWHHNTITAEVNAVYNDGYAFDELATEEQGKLELYALDANGNPHSPSWYTVNARVIWQASKSLTAQFGVDNISDQRYRPYSSGLAGAGRNFIGSLRVSF